MSASSVAAATLIGFVAVTATEAAVTVLSNRPYGGQTSCGGGSSLKCYDLWVPMIAPSSSLSSPLSAIVVFVHGGLWWSGSRGDGTPLCSALASRHRIACASVDYQYSGDVGGCCAKTGCPPTYDIQAKQIAAAVVRVHFHSLPFQVLLVGYRSS